MLIPGTKLPDIAFETLDGGRWTRDPDASMTVIDLYRGLHCPRCRAHLETVAELLPRFGERGARVVAVSMDPRERAERARDEWAVAGLDLGFGLSREDARALRGYLSTSVKEGETDVFAEPAVVYVQPDGLVYGALYGTFPFVRPRAEDLLEVVEIVTTRGYPPRGTLVD